MFKNSRFLLLLLLLTSSFYAQEFSDLIDKKQKIAKSLLNKDLDSVDFIVTDLISKTNNESQQAQNFSILASSKLYRGDLDSAILLFHKTLSIYMLKKDSFFISRSYANLGVAYKTSSKFDTSLIYYKESLKYLNNKEEEAYLLNNLGSLYLFEFKNLDSANYFFNKSEEIAIKRSLNTLLSTILLNKGVLFDFKQDKPKALDCYLRVLKLSDVNEVVRSRSYHNIANLYLDRGNYSLAEEYSDSNYINSKNIEFLEGITRSRITKSKIFLNQKKLDRAIRELELIDYNSSVFTLKINLLFSEIYLEKYNLSFDEVFIDSVAKYLKFVESSNVLSPLTSIEKNIIQAKLYEIKEDFSSAESLYEQSFTIAKNNHWLEKQKEISSYLVNIYDITNKYEKAFYWVKISNQFKAELDSLFNQKELGKVEERFANEVENQRLIAKSKEAELLFQSKSNEQKNYINFLIILVLLLCVLFLGLALYFSQKVKNNKINLITSESRLIELELQVLRSQMNPHFLFNTLQSIQSYILSNSPIESYEYLYKFSFLLRSIIQNSKLNRIPILEEIEIIKTYLELEKLRHNNLFNYKIVYSKEEVFSLTILPMIIQPLVENSIIHGLQNKKGEGCIEIGFEKSGKTLKITIEDNGVGRNNSVNTISEGNSIAIQNIKDRLSYNKGQKMYFIDKKDNVTNESLGTIAIIEIVV